MQEYFLRRTHMLQYDSSHGNIMVVSELGGSSEINYPHYDVPISDRLIHQYRVCKIIDSRTGNISTPISRIISGHRCGTRTLYPGISTLHSENAPNRSNHGGITRNLKTFLHNSIFLVCGRYISHHYDTN